MADHTHANRNGSNNGTGWGRLVSRLEREDGELLPGIVVRDGKIAPGPGAADPTNWVSVGKFAIAAGRLLWSLLRDERVPVRGKIVAGAAAAYAISPIDLVPDFVPGRGYIDDVVVVVTALRYLTDVAGNDLLREHWTGTQDGLDLLLDMVARG
jgi:uncharacterized membrane protein YkvA (DUF1232 family)